MSKKEIKAQQKADYKLKNLENYEKKKDTPEYILKLYKYRKYF